MPISVAAGEVHADSAILWVQSTEAVKVRFAEGKGHADVGPLDPVTHTGHVELSKLRADTDYRVIVRAGKTSTEARFHTPPTPDQAAPFSFAWSGDLGGQDVCRDTTLGYPIFASLNAAPPQLFIALGDLIYADGACNPIGRYGNAQVPGPAKATTLAGYHAWWEYNLADSGFATLRARVAQLNVWDDHEVVNDFGPHTDTRATGPYQADTHLLPLGLQAMRAYNPMPQTGPLYRTLRWGHTAEIFVLDDRSYRSANADPDGPTKTMLGAEQKAWLIDAVTHSDATWKIVITSSPLGPPSSGEVRDGWASMGTSYGFVTEAVEILRALSDEPNLLFLTTDLHFAAANRFHPFEDKPGFTPIELISGPLSAGFFPRTDVEPRLHAETLWNQSPPTIDTPLTWAQARGYFNLGRIDIDAAGALTATWVDADGRELKKLSFAARETTSASP